MHNEKINKRYTFRIYPSKLQTEQINANFDAADYVFNYFLDKNKKAYEAGNKIQNYFAMCEEIKELRSKNSQLKDIDIWVLRYSAKDLWDAYTRFFAKVKRHESATLPKNRVPDYKRTYRTSGTIHIKDKSIQIPKIGVIKMANGHEIDGKIQNVAIIKTKSNKYYASVCVLCDCPEEFEKTGKEIGIDVGVKHLFVASNGNKVDAPLWFEERLSRISMLNDKLSQQEKGSNNFEKTRMEISREYERISNKRKDFLNKLSTSIVKEYDVICVEELDEQKLLSKGHRLLSRRIKENGWFKFTRMLEYKSEWYGKKFVRIDRFFPSSQICSCCGFKNELVKDLSVRNWTCPQCGAEHDRDVNAAKNILTEGKRLLGA